MSRTASLFSVASIAALALAFRAAYCSRGRRGQGRGRSAKAIADIQSNRWRNDNQKRLRHR